MSEMVMIGQWTRSGEGNVRENLCGLESSSIPRHFLERRHLPLLGTLATSVDDQELVQAIDECRYWADSSATESS
jgi:hypothetical protein